MAISTNDFMKVVWTSVMISVLINFTTIGIGIAVINAPTETAINNPEIVYSQTYFALLTDNAQSPNYCQYGSQVGCTSTIDQVPAENLQQTDIIQQKINIISMIKFLFVFMGMSLIFPVYLANSISMYFSNSWIIALFNIIAIIWTTLTLILIIRYIFKK